MKILNFSLSSIIVVIISLPMSCKEEYKRPDHYSIDLFENVRNEQGKKMLSEEEATEKSLFIVKSNQTELINSPKINNKAVYIYKINGGKLIKTSKDSIGFPFKIISDYDLKINSVKLDSSVIYLINPKSYKLLINDFDVKYQTLSSAPVH